MGRASESTYFRVTILQIDSSFSTTGRSMHAAENHNNIPNITPPQVCVLDGYGLILIFVLHADNDIALQPRSQGFSRYPGVEALPEPSGKI
ncbi:uncharacterized protein ATNIH1004_002066 [Aspergillus tanneri]|uniref:Uncharacterized protein n=1 Tax=Aspergillus tanneri TaxID=1220188 RepID=A0A5M9M2R7_9EURO|nr:uncharacterized protein ATNIH1004_002066 [Aspergillus tanneri]KAA8641265.1 hypothetical protein ATNIH1004_002066 [Aspergillus tanneri]